MSFKRTQFKVLKKRLLEERNFIQVIMGPRQVGKTTLITQILDVVKTPHHFASADGVAQSDNIWLQQQWENARIQLKQSKSKAFILIIDEVQKIDNWSETVKSLWDEDTRLKSNIKLVLLGSSRLLLQEGLTESLAGRFERIYLSHWSFKEMQEAFGWTPEQYAWFGAYPGAVPLMKNESRWKDYLQNALIETSISKDILMLTRIEKPALMKRLFELGCAFSGQILSYNKMLGQLKDAGNTTTLSHYLKLLDTAGLLGGIEKFSPSMLRQRASSPKFQVYNTALISAQQDRDFKSAKSDAKFWGRIVESCIGAHLINAAQSNDFQLYYWREGNNEIDFVLQKGEKIIGIEVKSGSAQRMSGASAFKKKFPNSKLILVGQTGIPWEDFIKIEPDEL